MIDMHIVRQNKTPQVAYKKLIKYKNVSIIWRICVYKTGANVELILI